MPLRSPCRSLWRRRRAVIRPGVAVAWVASLLTLVPTAARAAAESAQVLSQPLSFSQAYEAALRNDAVYRGAGHELESARLGVPIARAALLPSVGLSASTSKVGGTRQFPNSSNQDMSIKVDYVAPQANLSLRVPLVNFETLGRYRQSQAQSEVAESTYKVRGLDLVSRLANNYLQVLLAEEAVTLVRAQIIALGSQLKQSQQRFQAGEGTRVDVAQLQASLDVSRARQIELEDQLDQAQRQLGRMTGVPSTVLGRLPPQAMPLPLEPAGLFAWLEMATRRNPGLQAREQAVTVARMSVQRNQAGHLPRLDLVASLSRSENESLSNLNQTATLRSLGLQLNVPLYSGGGVEAGVKQALTEVARAEEELRSERENVELEVQRYHQVAMNGAAKITAQRRAVESSELASLGARKALEAGVGTQSEVADTEAREYNARRELAQQRVDNLMSRARLLIVAGLPMAEVVADFDRALDNTGSATASK